jgi:voltage-gated potassium channel
MSRPPLVPPNRPDKSRFDTSWLRSLSFTVLLVGAVAAAIGADWSVTLATVAVAAVAFGFVYLRFPSGAHFGVTVASFLAIYGCTFEFFRNMNFPGGPQPLTLVSLVLPVTGFLLACFLRRRLVRALLRVQRVWDLDHLPRITRWFIGILAVGAGSFALPRLALDPPLQGVALLAGMAMITVFVVMAVHGAVLVMVDVAMVFESVASRLDRLIMPMVAFLTFYALLVVTFYALLVVVFACFYRIADLTPLVPQFSLHGSEARIGFVDALYYSVATITTFGFGDRAGFDAGARLDRAGGRERRADAAVRLQRDHAQRRPRHPAARQPSDAAGMTQFRIVSPFCVAITRA